MTDKQIPAFPLHNHGTQTLGMHFTGMTLRDYFAAKALQGMLANPKLEKQILERGKSWIEESAWIVADAMIKERNGQN